MEKLSIFVLNDILGTNRTREEMTSTTKTLRKEPIGTGNQKGSTKHENCVVEVFPSLLHVLIKVGWEEETD